MFLFYIPNRFKLGCCCWCYFGMSNRLPLNALSRDLIKMCQSMAIITQQLDKHLPIEYFNECLLRLTISPDEICLPSFADRLYYVIWCFCAQKVLRCFQINFSGRLEDKWWRSTVVFSIDDARTFNYFQIKMK